MSKPMLYVLCGLPYSGKSTLTKKLLNKFGLKVVSMDDVIDKYKFDTETMTQDQWDLVYSEGYEVLKQLLSKGSSVILDLGNLLKDERQTAKAIAEELNTNHILIYMNTSVSEIWDRWHINEQTQERGSLTKSELQKAIDMFESPTTDENYIEYKPSENLDEWINNNINQ